MFWSFNENEESRSRNVSFFIGSDDSGRQCIKIVEKKLNTNNAIDPNQVRNTVKTLLIYENDVRYTFEHYTSPQQLEIDLQDISYSRMEDPKLFEEVFVTALTEFKEYESSLIKFAEIHSKSLA